MKPLTLALALTLLASTANASTRSECTTRKSGSVAITSCSSSKGPSRTCRSYMSGSREEDELPVRGQESVNLVGRC